MRRIHELMGKMSFPDGHRGVMLSFMDSTHITSQASRVFIQRSPGVELCFLRTHADGGLTFLVRMKKGARAQRHGHPGGEESYILSGRLRIDRRVDAVERPQPDLLLGAGDHVFAPPGEVHEGIAEEDTLFLVVAPQGIIRPSPTRALARAPHARWDPSCA
jgi:quercetin dioxygenase-like cupin family protein